MSPAATTSPLRRWRTLHVYVVVGVHGWISKCKENALDTWVLNIADRPFLVDWHDRNDSVGVGQAAPVDLPSIRRKSTKRYVCVLQIYLKFSSAKRGERFPQTLAMHWPVSPSTEHYSLCIPPLLPVARLTSVVCIVFSSENPPPSSTPCGMSCCRGRELCLVMSGWP